MIKLVIFDLDGTLLNTIDDLADCTNYILKKNGFPTHEVEAYKYFVGSGVVTLLERALPKDISETEFSEIHEEFLHYYEIHKEDKTVPYDGMVDTLEKLQNKGIMLAVATNKPHELLPDLMKRFFPTIEWAAVFGNRKGVPVKPNPQIVFDILNTINNGRDAMHCVSTQSQHCVSTQSQHRVSTNEILYVGDTAVDMETAENAGITKIGVLWGFRTKEELENANADFIIEHPSTLSKITQ